MSRGLANLVQQSSDYDMFSFLDANREQNRGHVEALKKAFEEVGNLTKVQPILVNDKYQVIDGQHRFVACKELDLPIYFTVVSGLGVNEARSMNILHRGWTADDYARSYAESGNENYKTYQELREDYGFSHGITLAYILKSTVGTGGLSNPFKKFREGDLVIEDEAAIRNRLDKLAEIGEFTTLVNNRAFASAILKAIESEDYNQKRMIKKVRLYGERILKRYSHIEDNLRMVEELFNYGQQENSRARLF